MNAMDMFRKKFEDYRRLVDEGGGEHAPRCLEFGERARRARDDGAGTVSRVGSIVSPKSSNVDLLSMGLVEISSIADRLAEFGGYS